jgi:hypothetical protein
VPYRPTGRVHPARDPPESGSKLRMRFVSPRERVTPSILLLLRDHHVVIRAKERRVIAADRWQSEESQRRHISGVPETSTTSLKEQMGDRNSEARNTLILAKHPAVRRGSLRTATLRRVHSARTDLASIEAPSFAPGEHWGRRGRIGGRRDARLQDDRTTTVSKSKYRHREFPLSGSNIPA